MKIALEKGLVGDANQDSRSRGRSFLAGIIVFLLGMGAMALVQSVGYFNLRPVQGRETPVGHGNRDRHLINGPKTAGGTFEYIQIPLEEPPGRLPNISQSLGGPEWYFGHYSTNDLARFFAGCGLSPEQQRGLLNQKRWSIETNGIVVLPPPESVLALNRSSRERIYAVLSQFEQNHAQYDPFRFRPEKFDQWCADTGLGRVQLELLRQLTYMQGGSLCFADSAIVQALFTPGDFQRLVQALYGERTFLMRLVIHSDSDINAIINYWNRSGHVEGLRPLFESMAKVPGGTAINVSYLLPVFARVRLYTFATPTTDHRPHYENCFWTAMNFFREQPDPRFFSLAFTRRVLETDYVKTSDLLHYGDLIMLGDSAGRPIHLCVYLDDDVVFTKNGGDCLQPWVLMKIPDMRAYYNALEPAQMTVYRPRPSLANASR